VLVLVRERHEILVPQHVPHYAPAEASFTKRKGATTIVGLI
jgi:hypothetical protein